MAKKAAKRTKKLSKAKKLDPTKPLTFSKIKISY